MNRIDIASVVFLKTNHKNCVQSEYIEKNLLLSIAFKQFCHLMPVLCRWIGDASEAHPEPVEARAPIRTGEGLS